jgi:hypothetical protein
MQAHMYSNTHTYSTFVNIALLINPFPPPLPSLPVSAPYRSKPPLFTYLDIPLLVIVVRMSIHTRPWLMIDCLPLAP